MICWEVPSAESPDRKGRDLNIVEPLIQSIKQTTIICVGGEIVSTQSSILSRLSALFSSFVNSITYLFPSKSLVVVSWNPIFYLGLAWMYSNCQQLYRQPNTTFAFVSIMYLKHILSSLPISCLSHPARSNCQVPGYLKKDHHLPVSVDPSTLSSSTALPYLQIMSMSRLPSSAPDDSGDHVDPTTIPTSSLLATPSTQTSPVDLDSLSRPCKIPRIFLKCGVFILNCTY